MGYNGPAV